MPAPHRPPTCLHVCLIAIATGAALTLIASVPASQEMQIIASGILLAFMLVLSLTGRDHPQNRLASVVRIFLIGGAILLSLRYLIWRGTESLPLSSGLPSAICGLTLFVTECYCFVVATLGYLTRLKKLQRTSPPLPSDTSLLPEVDVFITTYDEDPAILKTTLIAATQLRYPTDKLHVYVLDDGGTHQMLSQSDSVHRRAAHLRANRLKEIASEFGAHYLTRRENIHAKAGNLNHALGVTQGELIVVLDCDHVPAEDFIEKTAGFFLQDPKLFLVQTAHQFVTPDPLERNLSLHATSPGESEMFYHSMMPGLDYWGSAFFCGSAAMLRRSAIESIGGFSTDTLTEDAETSLDAFSHGYTSVYLGVPLVSGLQPDTFSGFIKQRSRWAQGMWQILLLKNPWRRRGLSVVQRLMYTNFALYWGFPLSRLCLMLMPMLALLWGVTLAEASVVDVLSYCLPAMVGPMITNQFLHGRFRWPLISQLYQVIQSIHLTRSELQLFGNLRAPTFLVTSKAEILEEDFLSDMAKPFYLLLTLSFAALVACALRLMQEPAQREMWLFIGFWAAVDCMFLLCALGVTFERRQRRTEPRTPTAGSAHLQTPSNRLHHGVLTDVSASGAGLLLSNHAELWHALIHQQSVFLRVDDKFILNALIQKITQRDDGQISVGISYQLDTVTDARAAVAIAYGSSAQLRRNLASCQVHRNFASMIVTLLSKAITLGLGHLRFLLMTKIHKSPRMTAPPHRLLWRKNHESTDASLPSHRHRNTRVDDRLRNDGISVR